MSREIFVFGSNTEGRHGAGAAKCAVEKHGAIYGVPMGLQGNSYAIITKELRWDHPPVDLSFIACQVDLLIRFAEYRLDLTFRVTEIGCGLAGFTPQQIGPMFNLERGGNIILPDSFVAHSGGLDCHF